MTLNHLGEPSICLSLSALDKTHNASRRGSRQRRFFISGSIHGFTKDAGAARGLGGTILTSGQGVDGGKTYGGKTLTGQ